MLEGFALEVINGWVAKDVFNSVASFNLRRVADEFGGGSPLADVVLEDVDKLFVGLEGVGITHQGAAANKDGGGGASIVNGGGVRVDDVGGKRLVASGNVVGSEGSAKEPFESCAHGDSS